MFYPRQSRFTGSAEGWEGSVAKHHPGEAQRVEQAQKICTRVGISLGKDAVVQGSVEDFLLRGGTGGGFQVRVGLGEDAGFTVIDVGLVVIEGGNKDLGGWERYAQDTIRVVHVRGGQAGEVHAGDDIAMRHKEQTVAEEWAKDALVDLGRDDLFHGILDGFKAGKSAHLVDDGDGVGDEGGGRVEELRNLGAEAGVGLLEGLEGGFELA